MNSGNKYLLLISAGPKIASAFIESAKLARQTTRPKLVRLDSSHQQRASSEQQRSKVGFPIRRFTDQSLFAAPHDLSQRTTSFIASQRQGIHQTPFRHLIALIAKARLLKIPDRGPYALARKDQFCFKRIRGFKAVSFMNPRLVARRRRGRSAARLGGSREPKRTNLAHPAFDRMRFLFTMSDITDAQHPGTDPGRARLAAERSFKSVRR